MSFSLTHNLVWKCTQLQLITGEKQKWRRGRIDSIILAWTGSVSEYGWKPTHWSRARNENETKRRTTWTTNAGAVQIRPSQTNNEESTVTVFLQLDIHMMCSSKACLIPIREGLDMPSSRLMHEWTTSSRYFCRLHEPDHHLNPS